MIFIQQYISQKVQQIFCTDIDKDGMLEGPSFDLYKKIIQQFPSLYFIASGGVRNMQDVEELKNIGCAAVIIGKSIV